MVVQCPTCSSKFRIADDKVTDRGVRVRCTSCKNVFQVRKSGVVPAEPPAAPSPAATAGAPLQSPALAAPSAPARQPVSRPPPSKPPAAGNGAGRKSATDDLFGMAELTGDAPRVRTTPPKGMPMPDFDDIDINVKTDPETQPVDPRRGPEGTAKPAPRPPETPLPPSISGEHVKLGAFKTVLKDPFEGMDMGEPGTGAIELATQPKKDKLAEAARAEVAARAKAAESAPAEPVPAPQEPEVPAGRAIVSSALTGLLGAALAIAVVIVSALDGDTSSGWLGLGTSNDIVATRVVSGIYDTAGGKQVFYVRGRVENRSQKVRGPVRVTAELVADGAPEGRAEAIAGAEPTPEDVWSLKSPADAEKLARSLETSAVERRLPPGSSLPFFAVIAEPPQDLQNRRLRVRVETVDAWVPPAQAKGKGSK